ncbi:MAG: hypothetical protein ACYTFW_20415 [Planctomycetota bacterium]|jgi:hypothetical protein
MPDYNPDKESHRDHKWIVHKSVTGHHDFTKVNAGGKVMPFNGEGRLVVNDEGLANEIRQKYPATTTVTRVSAHHSSDRGHKYFFNCPAMPWHKDPELPNAPPPTDHDFDSADLDSPQG